MDAPAPSLPPAGDARAATVAPAATGPVPSRPPSRGWVSLWVGVLVGFFLSAGLGLAWRQASTRRMEAEAWQALVDPAARDPGMTAAEPVATDGARELSIGLYLEGIIGLSIRDSRFTAVCDVWFSWRGDDFDPADDLVVVDGSIESIDLLDQWHEGDLHHRRYRLTAGITKRFQIDHFPLDRHLLLIAFESGALRRDELLLVPDLENTAVSSRAAVPGYRLEHLVGIEKPHSYRTARGEPGDWAGRKATYSQARFAIAIGRDGWGLFLKMFQALFVAVVIALLPCFIKPTDLDPRFGLGVGALFATVANAYLVGSYVPDTGEFALADMINLLGTVTILLTLIESTISLHLHDQRGDRDAARRLDRVSFGVTLGGFVAALALILLAAGGQVHFR